MRQSLAVATIVEAISGAWQDPFRGEIYEYAAGLNLQVGYAVKGNFDIATARQLIEPMQALRDPSVRLVSIQAAVQTLKSFTADATVPYWIEHDPGDVLWLFEDDAKAKQYSDERAMALIRSIDGIYRLLEGVDRHDKTKTSLKFSHCKMRFAGLNEGNVQSLSWRYVIIDEAWMARANGLISQAMDRTKQYPDTKKILIMSQGGWEDEDQDKIHRTTDMRELHFSCPLCGFAQPFDVSRLREGLGGASSASPISNPGSSQGLAELAPPKDGTYSGLSWDTNETTRPAGRWNFGAVAKTAHIRCYACDGRIEDTPDIRRRLNDSYHFVPTNPQAQPGHVGFHWPELASMRIPFAHSVVKYLSAKVDADQLAYRLPLQQFYQKHWGLTWSDGIAGDIRAVVHEPYDITSDWAEEAHRPMIVDCQRDLAKFYYTVFAVSLAGECRELERGTKTSFAELADVQKTWKVRDQQVFLDCGYQMTRVLRECVRHGHVGTVRIGGKPRKLWLCWTGLKGSGAEMFVHLNPRTEVKEWRIYSDLKFYDVNAGTSAERGPRAPWFEWSNLHCKDLLRARRDADPGLPKYLTLPDSLPSTDPWSYYSQMRSEKRVEEFRAGKKRAIWLPIKLTRPNHEWDKGAMLMAFLARVGIIGEQTSSDLLSDSEGASSASP